MASFYSICDYTANGSIKQFDVTFPYISRDHVEFSVDGIDVSALWVNDTRIELSAVPASGKVVRIRRVTPRDTSLVDFIDGGPITESQLDLVNKQNLFIAQENLDDQELTRQKVDAISVSTGNVPVPSPANDNNKVLKVVVGGFQWSDEINLTSGTFGTLIITNTTTTNTLSVTGSSTLNTLNVSGVSSLSTVNAITSVSTPLLNIRSTGAPGVLSFDRGSVSSSSPQFNIRQTTGGTQLTISATDGNTETTLLSFLRSGSATSLTVGTNLYPDTDGTRDLGTTTSRFNGVYGKKSFIGSTWCSASGSGASLNGSTSDIVLTYVETDAEGMYTDHSAKLTVKTAGLYLLIGFVTFYTASATTVSETVLIRFDYIAGGASSAVIHGSAGSTAAAHIKEITEVRYLNVGDTFTLQGSSTSTTTVNLSGTLKAIRLSA